MHNPSAGRCSIYIRPLSPISNEVSAYHDPSMPSLQLLSARKRHHPESAHPEKPSPRSSKRQKADPATTYWDKASKTWLTKSALEELDRRTRPCPPYQPRSWTAHCITNSLALQRFSRHGGPDLSDLRHVRWTVFLTAEADDRSQYPEPEQRFDHSMSSSMTGSSRSRRTARTSITNTSRTKSTGPYDRQFEQVLVDNGVYSPGYRYPDSTVLPKPDNWNEFPPMLAQARPSLSPSRFGGEEHSEFVQADADACKEKQVRESVMPYIEGRIKHGKCRAGGVPFGNLDDLTDTQLTPANPDIWHSARPEQLNRGIRDKLSTQIIPSTQDDLPIVPNFFVEVKGPDGSAAVATREASYYGAFGARGMHAIKAHPRSALVPDNAAYSNAYTISSIYSNGQLEFFSHHMKSPRIAHERPEYVMQRLGSYAMRNNPETFRAGATAYRNARDWAEEQRNIAISQANERSTSDDGSSSPALSFTTAQDAEESYTMMQDSEIIPPGNIDGSGDDETDSSVGEPVIISLPSKRSTRQSARQQTQSKRHDMGK